MHNEKEGMPVTALREIKILKVLKHPCIVELLDMFVVRSQPISVVFYYYISLTIPLLGQVRRGRVLRHWAYTWCFLTWIMTSLDYWRTKG